MPWGFKEPFELYGVSPDYYVVPPSLSDTIEELVDTIRNGTGSVIVAGPLGSGKTSLISYLKNDVRSRGIEVLSATAVGSLGYLAEQFAENMIGTTTYRGFWKQTYDVYVPTAGSGRLVFGRLMQGMKKDAESRSVKYLLAIDEFKPLLWARSDIRRSVIEHLAHAVNDRTSTDVRYANVLFSLIQRPDQDTRQVFDQFLTVSTRRTKVERSAFERRFRSVVSLFYTELDISMIASSNILRAKHMDPSKVREEDFVRALRPYSFEALIYAARISGRNPGFCMLLVDDALREVERNLKNMDVDPDKIEIDEKMIDVVSRRRFEQESKRLSEEQVQFLRFLETPRKPQEVALRLNVLRVSKEDVEAFVSDLQGRGLVEKTTDDLITTTLLWSKGSRYVT